MSYPGRRRKGSEVTARVSRLCRSPGLGDNGEDVMEEAQRSAERASSDFLEGYDGRDMVTDDGRLIHEGYSDAGSDPP